MQAAEFCIGQGEFTDAVLVGTSGNHVRVVQALDVMDLTPDQARQLRDALSEILEGVDD